MTNPQWQSQEPQPQWTQPPFAPGPSTPSATPGSQQPVQSAPVGWGEPRDSGWTTRGEFTGGVLVPQPIQTQYAAQLRVPPAAGAEVVMRTVASVLFPAMIVLAILGVIGWFPAIMIALIVPGVLNRRAHELKRRRIAQAQYEAQLSRPEDDLR